MIEGTGRKEPIVIKQRKAGKPNKRGTGFEETTDSTVRAKAVVSKREVTRVDNESGGYRQQGIFEFYVPPGTVEFPLTLGRNRLMIEWRGEKFLVSKTYDWPGSHQVLQADIPQIV